MDLDNYVDAYRDSFAFSFDNRIMLNWYPRRIIAMCDRSLSALELGVGHGFTCDKFADFFASYSVLDASPAVIARFREEFPQSKARIVETYFEDYEPGEQFDVIVMGFVLEHVADPARILRHYKRLLKPGGRCFVAVPNAESLHRRFGHAAGLLPDLFALGAGDRQLGHLRLYSVDTLRRELESAGYRVTRQEGIFLKPMTTEQLRGLRLSDAIIEGMCTVGMAYPELSAGLLFEATVDGAAHG